MEQYLTNVERRKISCAPVDRNPADGHLLNNPCTVFVVRNSVDSASAVRHFVLRATVIQLTGYTEDHEHLFTGLASMLELTAALVV